MGTKAPVGRFGTCGMLTLVCAAAWAQALDRVRDFPIEPVEWRLSGPGGGGCVTSLTESRHATNRLYATCDVGGCFVSEDGGRSYRIANHRLQDLFGLCVAEHPVDPDTIFLGLKGGICRSHDRGTTWTELTDGLPPKSSGRYSIEAGCIRFDPSNPVVVYAVDNVRHEEGPALYRSVNGGDGWTNVIVRGSLPPKCGVTDLAFDAGDSNRLLVSTTAGLYLSRDRGRTWRASNAGLPSNRRTLRLAASPNAPGRVYVTLHEPGGEPKWSAGVYRSDDGGGTWRPVNDGLFQSPGKPGQGDMFAHWSRHVFVHPANPDVVWIGGRSWVNAGVWKTSNGGGRWGRIMGDDIPAGWITFWGVSVVAMSVSPLDPDILSIGTQGHVFRTTDGGRTWQNAYSENLPDGRFRGHGLETTCLHSIDPDPHAKGRFYCGFYDIGLLVTEDDGKSYRRCMVGIPSRYSNSCFGVCPDPAREGHLIAAFGQWSGRGGGCVAESRDGGRTWKVLTESEDGIPGAPRCLGLVDGRRGRSLYFCTDQAGLVESHDAGATWRRTDDAVFPDARRVRAVKIARGRVFAAVSCDATRPGAVWASDDDGESWKGLTTDAMVIGETKMLDAKGDRIVLCARGSNSRDGRYRKGGVWLSEDAGRTWRLILDDRFVSAVKIFGRRVLACPFDHPFHDRSGGGGILSTTDGGATWTTLNSPSLRNTLIECFGEDPSDPGTLWVGTCGNGILIGRIDTLGT